MPVRQQGGSNFDHIFAKVISSIMNKPEHVCSPRGIKVNEILAQTFALDNPRSRLLALSARDANYGFAVGEFFWYWLGKQDLESMLYYNKRMGNFSDDGFTLNSAYGYRTRQQKFEVGRVDGPGHMVSNQTTQWAAVKKTLLEDPDSRRAILIVGVPGDYTVGAYKPSKDLPCTLSLQFFIRDNRLFLHTTMRSNDVVWGLTYDLFSFTLLQECMMLELQAAGMTKLKLGAYYHTAGSLHIYEHHFKMASEIVKEYLSQGFVPAKPMDPISLEELASLADDEEALRVGKVAQIDQNRYSGGVRWMAAQLNAHRRKRDDERERPVGPRDSARAAAK